jgi:hypothetical protein
MIYNFTEVACVRNLFAPTRKWTFRWREPRIIFLFFPRAARAPCARAASSDLRQTNSAILKVPDAALRNIDQLDMDSCRGTIPSMEPPMHLSNCSMRHRELFN